MAQKNNTGKKLSQKMKNLLTKTRKMAMYHKELIGECDREMEKLGYDIVALRENDACHYVDMVDYGDADLVENDELENYKKELEEAEENADKTRNT